jgi:hypothetical protein
MTAEQSGNVFRRLGSFETMPWMAIQQAGLGHPIPQDSDGLSGEAPRRLAEISREQYDLYSLRIFGAGRVWGIKVENVLYVLWWDPNHIIYPWEPRNT